MATTHEDFLSKLKNSDEVKISVTGRKTKKERSTPVWFILQERTVRIVPVKGAETPWFRNLVEDPQISLSVGGASVSSKAKLVPDPAEAGRIVDQLRAKYKSQWSDSYYPRHDTYVEVPV